jgi:hypothetical protein
MTYTKREQIVAAVAAKVATVPGASHWRSRAEAIARAETPATVTVSARNVPSTPQVSTCRVDNTLTIQVAVNTRGAVPDQLADPILAAIHVALMADRTIGGLAVDITPGPTDWQVEKGDLTSCWALQDWNVQYRTAPESLA